LIFALAGHLGKTVSEIEATMDASEFAEWCSLISIEPWGGARLDVLSAMQQYAALAPWCRTRLQPTDFLPKWGQEESQKNNFAEAAKQIIERAKVIANGRNSNC
jgi:hypothetical protein